ncbi:MAG: ArsI/CadI family heavy metal resistance metalloenzyme [Pseudomonadota bacterium]
MKLHLSMHVENFDEAIKFYSALFGTEPMIVKDGYAKWDVADPPVNFVIDQGCCGTKAPGVDHFGIQVDSHEELETMAERIRGMDRPFLDVEATTCCYAKMEKAWVKGEANDKWEAFLTHSHGEAEYGTDRDRLLDQATGSDQACC